MLSELARIGNDKWMRNNEDTHAQEQIEQSSDVEQEDGYGLGHSFDFTNVPNKRIFQQTRRDHDEDESICDDTDFGLFSPNIEKFIHCSKSVQVTQTLDILHAEKRIYAKNNSAQDCEQQSNSGNEGDLMGTHDANDTDDIGADQENKVVTQSLRSYECYECPLKSSKTVFGLSSKHKLRNIPCKKYLSPPFALYDHLQHHHDLNHHAASKIIQLLINIAKNGLILDSNIDLFSHETIQINRQNPTRFKTNCPLTQYGVYGVLKQHQISLCTGRHGLLRDHLCRYHNFAPVCARKFVKAVMNKINKTEQLFDPNEVIIDQNLEITCPFDVNYSGLQTFNINHPVTNTPCSKKLKKFNLQQHLRQHHHLTLDETRRIMREHRNDHNLNITKNEHDVSNKLKRSKTLKRLQSNQPTY
ncbi:unnamed protein product [Didymodactylos carnosus]|nr:unnamed protein product [Didymodactylos carnosus]CAF3859912.1 unnamed protein product [Didymodactylos carnosus]